MVAALCALLLPPEARGVEGDATTLAVAVAVWAAGSDIPEVCRWEVARGDEAEAGAEVWSGGSGTLFFVAAISWSDGLLLLRWV